jgi:hypothetical protein
MFDQTHKIRLGGGIDAQATSAAPASPAAGQPGGQVEWVSSVSRWTDTKWVFDGRSPGSSWSTVTCIWDFELFDGSTLLDEKHWPLLNEARQFLWSLYADRRDGRLLKQASAGVVFTGLRRMLKWMVAHNYASFGELNNRASMRFCDWLVDFYATPSTDVTNEPDDATSDDLLDEGEGYDELGKAERAPSGNEVRARKSWPQENEEFDADDVGGVTPGTLGHALSTWRYLWQQRSAMTRLGLPALQEQPFSGRAVHKVSVDLTTKLATRIPALPDEVAISLMNAAHKFIATTSSDLIKLVNGVFQIHEATREGKALTLFQNAQVKSFLNDFEFSTPLGATHPWHEPLGSKGTSSLEELRRLIDDLVDACTISAQAESGMRVGEISNLLAGVNPETSLPSCITVRTSKSGMLDLYYLKSKLKKLRPLPVDEEWLLAAAPRGTTELPDAVRAIVVLQEVLAPLRAMAKPEIGQYLIITISIPRGLPSYPAGVAEPRNNLLRTGQKSFARSFVDWSEISLTEETRPYKISQGNCIRTHQWRKTYAQYVFQVDKRMLPAIARQFKHLSLAMTEGAYVGTSSSLVAGIADFNRNLTADLFLHNIRGTAPKQEGRLAKLMAAYRPELEKIVEGLNDREAQAAIDAWCRNRDMKIFFHGYGKCIPAIAPIKAECHKRAKTVHWANKAPNFSMREPAICTGCFLFLVDPQNIDHWNKRYVENMTIWLQAEAQGRGNEYRVAKVRAEQAKAYLLNLGADLPSGSSPLSLLEMTNAG